MKSLREGQLVTVAGEGQALDGIVYHAPSLVKVVVAVPDDERGPVFRTVHRRAVSERQEAGPDDDALRRLIRREGRVGARGGQGGGQGRRAHTRGPMHRTTGK
jgi:alpha-acetolactate decarboxylase